MAPTPLTNGTACQGESGGGSAHQLGVSCHCHGPSGHPTLSVTGYPHRLPVGNSGAAALEA
eukprot:2998385-Rhodomonas_salina.2